MNTRALAAILALFASTLVAIAVTGSPAASQSQTMIHVYNMNGALIGANLPTDWTPTNSTINAAAPNASRVLLTAVHQDGVRLTLALSAPLGQDLALGTYVAGLNEPTATRPGLTITNSAADPCDYSNSFFEVLELEVADTTITKLAVDVQYNCKTAAEAPWTLISVRLNSAVPTDQGAPVLTGTITGVEDEPVEAATICLGNPALPIFTTLGPDCAVTAADGTYSLDSTPFLALAQDRDRPNDYFLYVIPSLSSGYRNDCWYTADGCASAGYLSLHDDAGVAVNTNLDLGLTRGCGNAAATILGTDGNDEIAGTAGPDVIVSLAGDDIIRGGDGDDLICTGLGNNTVLGGTGDDRVFGSTGNDVFRGQEGNDWLWGDGGNDLLRGNDGNDVISGIDGSDNINGGRGNDSLDGGAGDDIVRGGTDNDTVFGGGGSDQVNGNGGEDVVNGGAGNDTLVAGGPRKDTVNGGDGDDVVKGLGGPDYVVGGPGNDSLYGGKQNDSLLGGDGTDLCNGGSGDFDSHLSCEDVKLVEVAIPVPESQRFPQAGYAQLLPEQTGADLVGLGDFFALPGSGLPAASG